MVIGVLLSDFYSSFDLVTNIVTLFRKLVMCISSEGGRYSYAHIICKLHVV